MDDASSKAPAVMPPDAFPVSVEGIGNFVFYRETGRRRALIAADARAIFGPRKNIDPVFGSFIYACSALLVLTYSAPAGWNVDDLDPLVEADRTKLDKVMGALREAEASFRQSGG